MTDDINADHVHVAADQRRHPALQKLGRAFIALARDQLKATADPMTDDVSAVPARATPPATNQPEATHD